MNRVKNFNDLREIVFLINSKVQDTNKELYLEYQKLFDRKYSNLSIMGKIEQLFPLIFVIMLLAAFLISKPLVKGIFLKNNVDSDIYNVYEIVITIIISMLIIVGSTTIFYRLLSQGMLFDPDKTLLTKDFRNECEELIITQELLHGISITRNNQVTWDLVAGVICISNILYILTSLATSLPKTTIIGILIIPIIVAVTYVYKTKHKNLKFSFFFQQRIDRFQLNMLSEKQLKN